MQLARRGECAPIVHSRRRAEDCPAYQASKTAGPYSGQIFDAANRWLQQWSRAIGRDFNRLLLLTPGFSPSACNHIHRNCFNSFCRARKAVERLVLRSAFCTRLKPGVNRSARLHSASIARKLTSSIALLHELEIKRTFIQKRGV